MPGSVSLTGRQELRHGHVTYHRSGSAKPALVTLHGLGDNGLCWRRVAEVLVDHFDVILLDCRGHGGSAMPARDTVDQPADDLRTLLDALGIDRATILGHSIGALSAAVFTAAHNDRVAQLVLEDPPLRNRAFQASIVMVSSFRQQMADIASLSLGDAMAVGREQHPAWHPTEFSDWAQAKQQVNPDILGRYRFPPWREVLCDIEVPSLLIYGASGTDSVVSEARAREVVEANPHFRAVCIEGAGHNVRRENYEQYVLELHAFLGLDEA